MAFYLEVAFYVTLVIQRKVQIYHQNKSSISLMKVAASSFESLVHTYQTIRRHIPVNGNNHGTCLENLKFHPNCQISKPQRKTKEV
jgi:hypothetical protein